jgi:PKD repeat protein
MAVLIITGMTTMGCRQAIYEIVKPASNSEGDPERQDFKGEGNPGSPNGSGPTARVEVVWNGKSVTQVKVNEPTIIRPSTDTLDPDDIGKSDCTNPGIVKATYQIAQEASPAVDRGVRCEPLSTPYTFKTEGVYVISMTVTSNEGETAVASMTLRVVNEQNQNDFGGFTITANPLLAKVNQNIQFEGICTTPAAKVIRWKFADGAEGEGVTTSHAYGKSGSYLIQAQCQETTGANRTWEASLTVVVMDEVPSGAPIPTDKPEPPGLPGTPISPPPPGNPPVVGTGGGKTGGGQTTGGQKKCIFIFHCKSHW